MIKTVTLTANTEQAVKIEGGTYCSIENRGEGVVYASKHPNVSALADNVVAIDPGNNKILENATKKSNNGTMQGTIYLIADQKGTVEIRTATTVNPFKIKRKGGDTYTKKEIDAQLSELKIVTTSWLTLTASAWTNNTQSVSCTLDTNKRNVIDVKPESVVVWAECGVLGISETATDVTFQCNSVPTVDLLFRITSMEVI